MKIRILSILIVGMTMGTSWAVRGQFGHEQGAAWAAAIAALALVLASANQGWYRKALTITLASAVGWGMGGMISYGKIVGYGRSDDFPNAFYGLLMLFVIGSLYGLLGGGLTGLTLESSGQKKVSWARLVTEMVAGGLIVYGFLVMQLGLEMTPPRSEAWALCLGSALAMLWYMARNGYNSSMRVALISGLGAGFGFAFGNFLQIIGNVLEINFNMWNVMEYSIGFFGGSSMAYAVFTTAWPGESNENLRWENRVSFLLVFVMIPMIVYHESMQYPILLKRLGDIANVQGVTAASSAVAAILIAAMMVSGYFVMGMGGRIERRNQVMFLFAALFAVYVIISYLVTGLFAGMTHLNHHLYIVNVAAILYMLYLKADPFSRFEVVEPDWAKLIRWFGVMVIVIAILTFILINTHGELGGAQVRFGEGS